MLDLLTYAPLFAVLATLLGAIIAWLNSNHARARLKADLEIEKLLREKDAAEAIVVSLAISEDVVSLYAKERRARKSTIRFVVGIVGAVILLGLALFEIEKGRRPIVALAYAATSFGTRQKWTALALLEGSTS